jgi:hypothetical protein
MNLPPAVTIHRMEQARAALAPGLPVTLISAPWAGVYAGAGWWLALIAGACGDALRPPHMLDCGTAAGRALEAARAGQALVVLRAPDAIFAEVRGIAAGYGTVVLGQRPPSLDLAKPGGPRDLEAWLMGNLPEGAA